MTRHPQPPRIYALVADGTTWPLDRIHECTGQPIVALGWPEGDDDEPDAPDQRT